MIIEESKNHQILLGWGDLQKLPKYNSTGLLHNQTNCEMVPWGSYIAEMQSPVQSISNNRQC